MTGPACTCLKWAPDPECPLHGNPGQLTLGHEDESVEQEDPYDPATAPFPEGY